MLIDTIKWAALFVACLLVGSLVAMPFSYLLDVPDSYKMHGMLLGRIFFIVLALEVSKEPHLQLPRTALPIIGGITIASIFYIVDVFRGEQRTILADENGGIVRQSVFFLTVCLIGPISEEILFRKRILEAHLRRLSISKAVFLNLVLFNILHLDSIASNPLAAVSYTCAGLMFCAIQYKTKSIVLTSVAHVVYNITLFALNKLS